jgi:hypothetical protein
MVRPLNPLKLKAASLQNKLAISQVCQLLEQHFSEQAYKYGNVLAISDWRLAMNDLYRLIEEAGWFEVDRNWWEALRDEELSLEDALRCPPVSLYGYDESYYYDNPPLRLIQTLLEPFSDPYWGEEFGPVSVDDLKAWMKVNSDRLAARGRLGRPRAGPALYPKPLRCLPELARWVRHETGNLILDHSVCECGYQHVWNWDDDLAAIKPVWRQARRAIVKLRGLLDGLREWYQADGRCLATIAGVLMEDNYG